MEIHLAQPVCDSYALLNNNTGTFQNRWKVLQVMSTENQQIAVDNDLSRIKWAKKLLASFFSYGNAWC